MSTLKARLSDDLRASMKARDVIVTGTLRMALAAVRRAEVAGEAARELSDDEVLGVLTREAKKRREAAEAYVGAGRTELAEQELAELAVVERYLPAQLSDRELAELVARAVAAGGFAGQSAMGMAMKAVQAELAQSGRAGRAAGARVAAEVRRQLASNSAQS